MRKHLIIIALSTFAFLLNCSHKSSPTEPQETADLSVNMLLKPAADNGYNVTRVHVKITRSTFVDSMDLTINGESASGTFTDLKVGTYQIEVWVYEDTTLIATGSGTGEVKAGQTVNVTITVTFLTGNLGVIVNWGEEKTKIIDNFNRVNNDEVGNGWQETYPELARIVDNTLELKSVNVGGINNLVYQPFDFDTLKSYKFSFYVKSSNSSSNYIQILFGANLTDPVHPMSDVDFLGIAIALSNDPSRSPHSVRLFRNNNSEFTSTLMSSSNVPQAGVYSKIEGTISKNTLELTIDFLNDGSRVEHLSFSFTPPISKGRYVAIGNYDGIGKNVVKYNFDDFSLEEIQ